MRMGNQLQEQTAKISGVHILPQQRVWCSRACSPQIKLKLQFSWVLWSIIACVCILLCVLNAVSSQAEVWSRSDGMSLFTWGLLWVGKLLWYRWI